MNIRNIGLVEAGAGILLEWLWGSPFRLASADSEFEF